MLMIALHAHFADYYMARNNHAIIKRDLHRARQAGDHHLVPELDHQRDILHGMLQEATERLGHYRPLP